MRKTLLFPTDFTVASLSAVRRAIPEHPGQQLDIVLIHGIYLTDSITELLFFSRHAVVRKLASVEFDAACGLLCRLYADQINSFRIELFTGFTQTAFDNFLEGLQADSIYLPDSSLLLEGDSRYLSEFLAKSKVALVPGQQPGTASCVTEIRATP